MPAPGTRWRVAIASGAAAAGLALWLVWPDIRSAALLMDLADPGSRVRAFLPVGVDDVRTSDVTIPTRHGAVVARIYAPVSGSSRTIVVFPGVHAGGVDEPRLAALTRRVAGGGATVVAVPLPDLRQYRITPHSTDQMEDAVAWVTNRRDLAPDGRVGVIGVSFAGGLALVAGGRPGVRGRLSGIVSLGGHGDLPRAMAYACNGRLPDGTLRPPHDYGSVLLLRAAVPRVVPPDQVAALDRAVVTFLDASSYASLDQARSRELFDSARAQEAALPEPARTLMHWVNTRDVMRLGARLLSLVEDLGGDPALSPERSPAADAPVFALNGELDNVIPSSELPQLTAYLSRAGNARVHALLTPVLSHADMQDGFGMMDGWRLARFWTKAWRGLTR
jgi:dienelactone hydrolase